MYITYLHQDKGSRISELERHVFLKKNNRRTKLFLQIPHPWQNWKISTEVIEKLRFRLFEIPARCPDINLSGTKNKVLI